MGIAPHVAGMSMQNAGGSVHLGGWHPGLGASPGNCWHSGWYVHPLSQVPASLVGEQGTGTPPAQVGWTQSWVVPHIRSPQARGPASPPLPASEVGQVVT